MHTRCAIKIVVSLTSSFDYSPEYCPLAGTVLHGVTLHDVSLSAGLSVCLESVTYKAGVDSHVVFCTADFIFFIN